MAVCARESVYVVGTKVLTVLNLRVQPSIDRRVKLQLAAGFVEAVAGKVVQQGGHSWLQISRSGQAGWAAQDYLDGPLTSSAARALSQKIAVARFSQGCAGLECDPIS